MAGPGTRCVLWRAPIAGLVAGALALALLSPTSLAQTTDRPRLETNESYINEATRQTSLATDDLMAVFGFVFESLPERVKVYPTENYYYFAFVNKGVSFGGNIRLDASDRDDGKLHFGYSEDLVDWRDDTPVNYRRLDATDGVGVEKIERFLYRVSYKGKRVTFELNDLSSVRPPAAALGPGDVFVGPVFDESAIRFFLLYNTRLKIFHYVLDETVPLADELVPAVRIDRTLIGKRTGFAFYRDHQRDRKILIGVFDGNARLNNYLDGPFDQLPDNFIEGDSLREMILAVDPSLKGGIDRFGSSANGEERFMIASYLYYQSIEDLRVFHSCATDKRVTAALYPACFAIDDQATGRRPQPVALKGMKGKAPAARAPRKKN